MTGVWSKACQLATFCYDLGSLVGVFIICIFIWIRSFRYGSDVRCLLREMSRTVVRN